MADGEKKSRLEMIRETVRQNVLSGRDTYAGLDSSEIGEYNRALMFGDDNEAFPDKAAWSRCVD